jgi:hypothetical protein
LIGKYTCDEDWQMQVELLMGNRHWIAQEYCHPDVIMAAEEGAVLREYSPVWGVFSISNRYSGSFLRAMPTASSKGIVNSDLGALEFVVLEELPSTGINRLSPKEVNQSYSSTFQKMCDYYSHQEGGFSNTIDTTGDQMPAFMQVYDPVHKLPLIISQAWVAEFSSLIKGYPALVRKVIRHMFEDSESFSESLNEPMILFDVFDEVDINPVELAFRFDLYSAGSTVRMLEVNVGTVIGGWQLDQLETHCREHIAEFESEVQEKLTYRDVCSGILKSVIDSVLEIKGENTSGVVLVGTDAERIPMWTSLEKYISEKFESIKPQTYKHAKVVFFHDLNDLEFDHNGRVIYQNQVVDALFTTTTKLEEQRKGPINMQLSAAYLSGHLAWLDSPFHRLYGNKLLMPLMHKYKLTNAATAEEVSFINRFIPWSIRVSELSEHGMEDLLQRIIEHPVNYVLKKNASSKGDDVLVGRFTDPKLWKQRVLSLLGDKDWLVQVYCKAPVVYLPDGEGSVVNADLVWGVFSFNGSYSGVYGRAMAETGQGVINQARGAVGMLVFEAASEFF